MKYTSFEQIERDLVILQLKRKITVEELKGLKNITSDQISITRLLSPSMLELASKLGVSLLLKRFFKF